MYVRYYTYADNTAVEGTSLQQYGEGIGTVLNVKKQTHYISFIDGY